MKNNWEFWSDELEDEYAFSKMKGERLYQIGEMGECVNQEAPSGYVNVRNPINYLGDCHAECWTCDI